MKKKVLIFFLLFLLNNLFAQKEHQISDSLIHQITTSKINDSLKIDSLSKIISKKGFTPDTKRIIDIMKLLANNTSNRELNLAFVYKTYANYYSYNSKLDSSLLMLEKAENLIKNP